MHLHGYFSRACRPIRDTSCPRNQVHRAAGVKARRQRGAGVKAVTLVVECSRTATWIDVRLQYGYVHPGSRQDCGSRQTTDPGADHDHPLFVGAVHRAVSNNLRVFQAR